MSDGASELEGESVRTAVYEAAVEVLKERREDEGFTEVTEWVTGTEIASRTGIPKDQVLEALTSLGDGRLRVRSAAGGHEIEVFGVDAVEVEGESEGVAD